jgi:hypothetical protein
MAGKRETEVVGLAGLAKGARIEVEGPESFIVDAARPLLNVCEQLIGYPQAKKKVQQARENVEKAMQRLSEAYSDVR